MMLADVMCDNRCISQGWETWVGVRRGWCGLECIGMGCRSWCMGPTVCGGQGVDRLGSGDMWVGVMRCLRVRLDPGFSFGVGVPESGVGLDGASASGLLHQLDFCVQYLAMGGGHVAGCNGEAVDSDKGDRHE